MTTDILAELIVELRVVDGRPGLAVMTSEAGPHLLRQFVISDPPVWFQFKIFWNQVSLPPANQVKRYLVYFK